MAKNPKRIVIDTNLWIHFLISKDFSNLDKDIFSGKAKLVFRKQKS